MRAVVWLRFPFGLKKIILDMPEPRKPTLEELRAMIPADCRPQRVTVEMEIELT